MNYLDRIVAMEIELAELDPNLTSRITFEHRPSASPELRWHVSSHTETSSGASPEDALRGLDARVTRHLEERIARQQKRIDAARAAISGGATVLPGEEGKQ